LFHNKIRNPAVDKQAAARCWRDGQKKRCFTYRFLATGTVEEKIFQRQLAKEGLQSVVDDKEQVNSLSTKDLKNLFKLRSGTPSDTHDKLKCERCKIIKDDAEMQETKILPKKLAACLELVEKMLEHEDAQYFLNPLNPQDHDVSKEQYEKKVKQPMDLGTIQKRLSLLPSQDVKGVQAYQSVSNVSKDVNRIFSNVMKIWSPDEDPIADAAGRLLSWWTTQWHELVPILMTMKSDPEKSEDDSDEEHSDDIMKACSHLNNERGEDYQEQIGMPDEEHMRNWSHHHSTDTVDDPIFRAAMRGYDSVSFVFALEVTWGLLQEREKEEEEMKALLELKELEGLEEEEEEDDDDDDDDEKDVEVKDIDVGKSEEDQVSVAIQNDPKTDDLDGDDSNSPVAEADVEVGTPSSSPSDDNSSESSEADTPEAMIIDSPIDEEIVEALPVDSTPPEATDCWICSMCTMENPKSKRKCNACLSKRGRL
jgi:hypothetical protein